MTGNPGSPATPSFVRDLHRALVSLYDPATLRRCPLVGLFSIEQQANPASALQRILVDAIEALKPSPDVPSQAAAWRTYRILFHRYAEQCTQVEVAGMLSLSERQLRREEREAERLLADFLWNRYGVRLRAPAQADTPPPEVSRPAEAGTPSREQEMEWLRKSLPGETADAAEATQAALKIAGPLAQALHVHTASAMPGNLPRLAIQPATLRQALLNVLTPAIRAAPHGEVSIAAEGRPREVDICIRPRARRLGSSPPSQDDVESLEMARQLVGLCGGTLAVASAQGTEYPFTATLTLPAAEQAAILVIDDNVDTLQLFQRCLAGTRYPFIGARDPEQALSLAEELHPRIIVLDLMLPGLDGWEVLDRLREHPQTRRIPIVVCSILPQEQLALTLGAAAFIRKPVSRATLLAALDDLVAQRPRKPR